jgi:hypothetical protein
MKKYAAICATLAALAWTGVAAADTAQGKLTGSAVAFGTTLAITSPVIDGGTTYVGKENDYSGNCNNDSGAVTLDGAAETIVCAHFVAASRDGSGPKMRFAFPSPVCCFCYEVWRISDGGAQGTDKVGIGFACSPSWPTSLAHAQSVVNRGSVGGLGVSLWAFTNVDGYTVTASQT